MDKLQEFLLLAPVLLFSMVAHEYAHGYAALRQGDPTAFQLGRLTWNPVKHIDPFMTVLLPLLVWFSSGGRMLFGGAKPVPVTPRNYRNYRRGDIIVSLAGIATNLVLAVVAFLLIAVLGFIGKSVPVTTDSMALLQVMMIRGVQVNLLLAMFNLLPIPPLDGSHVIKYILPPAWALRYQRVGFYGIAVLMLLMMTGVGGAFLTFWMTPATYLEQVGLRAVWSLILPSRFLSGL